MKRTFGRFSHLGRPTTTRDVLIPVWAREYPIEVLGKRRCKPSVIRCPRIAGSSRLQFSEACIMNTGWRRLLHDPERPWKSFPRRTGLGIAQRSSLVIDGSRSEDASQFGFARFRPDGFVLSLTALGLVRHN